MKNPFLLVLVFLSVPILFSIIPAIVIVAILIAVYSIGRGFLELFELI